jgi:hypothetical protein
MQRTISVGAVEQRAVPVEDDQVEAAGGGHGRSVSQSSGRGAQGDALAAGRVVEAQFTRVQEHARKAPLAGKCLVAREVAVLGVAHDGVAAVRQVHADLVRAAGLDAHVQQAEARQVAHHPDQADRTPAVGVLGRHHAHLALAGGVQRLVQGQVDDLQAGRPGAKDQRRIDLVPCRGRGTGPAVPSARCASWPAAGCPRSPCRAGAPVPGTAPAGAPGAVARSRQSSPRCRRAPPRRRVCRSPAGVRLPAARELARRGGRLGAGLGQAHRRHAHHVACGHPGIGLRAALVDPHFAAADDAVDVGLGHALEQADQVVVQRWPADSASTVSCLTAAAAAGLTGAGRPAILRGSTFRL